MLDDLMNKVGLSQTSDFLEVLSDFERCIEREICCCEDVLNVRPLVYNVAIEQMKRMLNTYQSKPVEPLEEQDDD